MLYPEIRLHVPWTCRHCDTMTSYMNRVCANPCSPPIHCRLRIPIDLMQLCRWNCAHRRKRSMHHTELNSMTLAFCRNCNPCAFCGRIDKVFPLSFRCRPWRASPSEAWAEPGSPCLAFFWLPVELLLFGAWRLLGVEIFCHLSIHLSETLMTLVTWATIGVTIEMSTEIFYRAHCVLIHSSFASKTPWSWCLYRARGG